MKKPLARREITLAIATGVSILLLLAVDIYCLHLRTENRRNQALIEDQRTLLQNKDTDSNVSSNYVETICSEYRKLYASYRELRYPDQTKVDKYIGLPGSAKGQIDDCYLPD
ncbi:MAG: hypothetical protein ABWX94_03245 [Candidatus Saccharimonadales bacterium]